MPSLVFLNQNFTPCLHVGSTLSAAKIQMWPSTELNKGSKRLYMFPFTKSCFLIFRRTSMFNILSNLLRPRVWRIAHFFMSRLVMVQKLLTQSFIIRTAVVALMICWNTIICLLMRISSSDENILFWRWSQVLQHHQATVPDAAVNFVNHHLCIIID